MYPVMTPPTVVAPGWRVMASGDRVMLTDLKGRVVARVEFEETEQEVLIRYVAFPPEVDAFAYDLLHELLRVTRAPLRAAQLTPEGQDWWRKVQLLVPAGRLVVTGPSSGTLLG